MNISDPLKHPEWKLLFEVLSGCIVENRIWSYVEIRAAMHGLDPQSSAGRRQVFRCIKEMRQAHDIHLECERGIGYRMVKASEHLTCSSRRVVHARRKILTAHHIAVHTEVGGLTEFEQRALGHAVQRLSVQVQVLTSEVREMKRLSVGRLPSPMLGAAKTG